MKKLLLYSILIGFLMACKASGNEKEKSKETVLEDATPVKVASAQAKILQIPIFASGIIAPQTEIKLSFKTGGVIEQMYVNEGSTVFKGQLLATLNLSEISAQVAQARIGLDKSKRDLNRAKNLYADSVATLEQVQNATTAEQISAKSLQIAEFNQRYSTIYAPVNGKVLKKFTEANELIAPSMPVFLVGSTESAWVVKVGLSDKDIIRVRLGDVAKVKIDAHPNVVFNATVSQIAQIASQGTGTFEVELLVENGKYPLISGMIAQAEISPQSNESFVTVPIGALVESDNEKGYVYVLQNDKKSVKKVAVKIQTIYQNEVALQSGLETSQSIVIEGAPYLRDKAKVKIVK